MTLADEAFADDPAGDIDSRPEAWTERVDRWLAETFARALRGAGDDGLALMAVGGHGRRALAPGSDLDLLLLHDPSVPSSRVAEVADGIWYPIWDEGMKLGHSVRTPAQALALAAEDLETATALLSSRPIVGDPRLSGALAAPALERWRAGSRRMLERLAESTLQRRAIHGEVAHLLEPELKEGGGGMRDIHAIRWAVAAGAGVDPEDRADLDRAEAIFTRTRVALHLVSGSRSDRLVLEHVDAVAARLGTDADRLSRDLSAAARRVTWIGDELWASRSSSRGGGILGWRSRSRAPGIGVRAGVVDLDNDVDPSRDAGLALAAAQVSCRLGARMGRRTLARLSDRSPAPPQPWPEGIRRAFVDLLATGRPAIGAVEALDHVGVWARHLPEWDAVRSLPQRNALHRHTVDRHILETVAGAASLANRVDRPDLLLMAALLHDIAKGRPEDHSAEGAEVATRVMERMGFEPRDAGTVALLVRHHLLLPEAATRRDVSDPATISTVAEAVRDRPTLRLLAALTEADALATGPAAWGRWRSELVADLVRRVDHHLAGGDQASFVADTFPSSEELELAAAGDVAVITTLADAGQPEPVGRGGAAPVAATVTVVAPDGEGLLARVTGALALAGLDVCSAEAMTASPAAGAMAIQRYRVETVAAPRPEEIDALIRDGIGRRIAIEARLHSRSRVTRAPRSPAPAQPTTVTFDDGASAASTVVEVASTDSVGLLHRLARALGELGLVVSRVKAQTIGERAVDAFYVQDASGGPVDDPALRREIVRALTHAADPGAA